MPVISFYKFTPLENLEAKRHTILELCRAYSIKGTALLSEEGINASLESSEQTRLAKVFESIAEFLDLVDVIPNLTYTSVLQPAFDRLQVRIRPELITIGQPFDFDRAPVPYVDALKWSELVLDPGTAILDVRNRYEVKLGRFERSTWPSTNTFTEFAHWAKGRSVDEKSTPTALYCTGGIRCEKAAQVLQDHGFEDLYQLNHGILGYLHSNVDRGLWQGECFVFDKRVSLSPSLHQGSATQCHSCRQPLTVGDRASNKYIAGVSCPNCFDINSEQRKERLRERVRQVEIARKNKTQHIGRNHAQHSIDPPQLPSERKIEVVA